MPLIDFLLHPRSEILFFCLPHEHRPVAAGGLKISGETEEGTEEETDTVGERACCEGRRWSCCCFCCCFWAVWITMEGGKAKGRLRAGCISRRGRWEEEAGKEGGGAHNKRVPEARRWRRLAPLLPPRPHPLLLTIGRGIVAAGAEREQKGWVGGLGRAGARAHAGRRPRAHRGRLVLPFGFCQRESKRTIETTRCDVMRASVSLTSRRLNVYIRFVDLTRPNAAQKASRLVSKVSRGTHTQNSKGAGRPAALSFSRSLLLYLLGAGSTRRDEIVRAMFGSGA